MLHKSRCILDTLVLLLHRARKTCCKTREAGEEERVGERREKIRARRKGGREGGREGGRRREKKRRGGEMVSE